MYNLPHSKAVNEFLFVIKLLKDHLALTVI